MRKRYIILVLMVVAVLVLIGYKKYFFSFDSLGHGTYFEGPFDSPTGRYTADSYYKTYGGAAGGAMIWVEITDHEKNQTETIYYAGGKSNFGIKWKDNHTIFIKNNEGNDYPDADTDIALDVRKEIYDESGRACDSFIMKNTYETCFQDRK